MRLDVKRRDRSHFPDDRVAATPDRPRDVRGAQLVGAEAWRQTIPCANAVNPTNAQVAERIAAIFSKVSQ